jgi:hypothetical protein
MMKLSVVVSFYVVFFTYDSIVAQSTEEGIYEEGITEVSSKGNESYAARFNDADECEDTCEDDCERMCERKCGKDNDECEDECTEKCDNNCEQNCSCLKPAYGPQKGSVLFSISGNYMFFHNSRISRGEDLFLKETNKYIIYTKDDKPVDTVLLKILLYKYLR